ATGVGAGAELHGIRTEREDRVEHLVEGRLAEDRVEDPDANVRLAPDRSDCRAFECTAVRYCGRRRAPPRARRVHRSALRVRRHRSRRLLTMAHRALAAATVLALL